MKAITINTSESVINIAAKQKASCVGRTKRSFIVFADIELLDDRFFFAIVVYLVTEIVLPCSASGAFTVTRPLASLAIM